MRFHWCIKAGGNIRKSEISLKTAENEWKLVQIIKLAVALVYTLTVSALDSADSDGFIIISNTLVVALVSVLALAESLEHLHSFYSTLVLALILSLKLALVLALLFFITLVIALAPA